ncbi:transcriptional regulator, LacI family [Candidatus Moduliflexus flocculans]|uniref:Transcriptional regulator, LacI family n=1 Tax=Candidatus Moduliflexus flocculans TaxID=1499966 RepID=A0A0S6VZR1_9BACT|nr:transcriptional regulator, LacI family [Candidatus Moduliflexus flocculans]
MINIKDVAEAADVSTATVSRVLADKPHVRPDIRERVLAAAERLNYRPNRVARSLRVQQSNTIGLIVADIRNPFFTSVSRAVEDIAYSQGCTLFLCNTDEDPEKEEMYLNLLRDENVSGVILAPTRETADAFAERVRLDVPMVIIDRRVRNVEVDSVLIDNVDAAHKLAEHLIQDGYRRVGAFFGIGSTTGRERKEGFLRAFEEHGITLPPEFLMMVDARIEPGYEAALKLLDLPEPPDALMSSNGLLAAGVYRAIQERQSRFAKPIGFASFDETNWTTLVRPPVTVIEQPTYEIGQTATELLLRRIEEPARPAREVILKTRMIVRQSCGCG